MKLRDLMPLAWLDRGGNGATDAKALTFTPQTAAFEFAFGGSPFPESDVDYSAKVRQGLYSSVITSALCWMQRTFPEAPLVVQRSVDERWENIPQHALTRLLRTPNPEYSGRVLWMATIMDFCYGEAFWLKVRNGGGAVVELYWIPRTMITPYADPKTGLLDRYVYTPAGYAMQQDVAPSEIVHFRFGKNPLNLLRGFSPLAAVMREVYTDDQAANFTAAILKNLGIFGVVFSPESGQIPPDRVDKLKEDVQNKFTGDNRGKALVIGNPIKAQLLQYNVNQFDVGPIRDIAEERVCAALGIPAAVIGFGTGLQQTKVGATMREMVKLAWSGGIEPVQAIMADELDRSLLPEFQKNTDLFRTHFDTSQVEALTESPAECTDRMLKLTQGNIITIAQAQRELGYPVDTSQDKYLRELTAAAAPAPASAENTPTDAAPTDETSANNSPGDENANA